MPPLVSITCGGVGNILTLGVLVALSACTVAADDGTIAVVPADWKKGEPLDPKLIFYNAKNSDGGRQCVCADSFEATHDYFPVKLGADSEAAGFSVTYHNSYKIINNTAANFVHVGYQCGTPKPTVAQLGFTPSAFVELPVSRVGVKSTTDVPFIEFLGDRESIVAVPPAVSSGCVKEMVSTGVSVVANSSNLAEIPMDAIFCSDGWGCSDVKNAVPIAAHKETTLLGTASWVEYIAAFYNRERAAQDVVASIKAMFNCHKARAQAEAAKVAKKPKVLWAYYSDYPGYESWYPGSCPNYYCELIAAAGGEMIMFQTAPGNNHTKFFETAKDADVWLFAGTNWEKMLATDFTSPEYNMSNFTAHLETMPAYKTGSIYDFQKNGQGDWFESRLAEPDVVLEDMIDLITPAVSGGHKRVWWRHVETEKIGGADKMFCDDVSKPLQLKADACGSISKRQAPRDTSRAAQPGCVQWVKTTDINMNKQLDSAARAATASLLAIAAVALVAVSLP